MLAAWLVALVAVATIGTILLQGLPLLFATQMPRLGPPPEDPALRTGPLVSVVLAARNEESDLGPALDGLLDQEYAPIEILVVDGGSTDGTRQVAIARAPRVRLIDEPPLPSGWVGKNWACHVGFQESRGSFVLFTDADMRYQPATIGATIAWAQSEGADLTTLAPRVEARTFWEKLVLPLYVQLVLTYFRTPRVNLERSNAAMANGQFTLVRRDAYQAVGGHEAVRGVVLEDVALARRFRAAGKRLRVAWAPDLLVTRMYRDRHEMFEGLKKNVHDTRFSAARQFGFLAGLVALFLLPLGVLPFGLATGSLVLTALGVFVYVAWFAKHALFARAIGMSAAYGLLFPLAVGFYVALVAASISDGLRHRPVAWKGRAYAMDGSGSGPTGPAGP